MSEWLDLMLEEIARKKREDREAKQEMERRAGSDDAAPADAPCQGQSK